MRYIIFLATFFFLLVPLSLKNYRDNQHKSKRVINHADFIQAIKANDVHNVRNNLNDKKLLDKADQHGFLPIHYAQDLSIVYELIIAGADLNKPAYNKQAYTPLYLALKEKNRAKAMMLLLGGARPNVKQERNKMPLMLAIEQGDYEMIVYFLQAGAKVNDRMLDQAKKHHRFSHLYELLYYYQKARKNIRSINTQDRKGQCLVHYAVLHNKREELKGLVLAGASINQKNKDGLTPLHVAVMNRLSNMVNILLDFQARCFLCDNWGKMPLHYAAQNGDKELYSLLVAHGASIYVPDNDGNRPVDLVQKSRKKEGLGQRVRREKDFALV